MQPIMQLFTMQLPSVSLARTMDAVFIAGRTALLAGVLAILKIGQRRLCETDNCVDFLTVFNKVQTEQLNADKWSSDILRIIDLVGGHSLLKKEREECRTMIENTDMKI